MMFSGAISVLSLLVLSDESLSLEDDALAGDDGVIAAEVQIGVR
jgi:hypothetical protein